MDSPDQHSSGVRRGLKLPAVKPCESGEGLPYAPENWPGPGDIWRWKVGVRVTTSGFFNDRYLYPPKHLPSGGDSAPRKGGAFSSKLAVERYIRAVFPEVDVEKFFSLFSWKIPCKDTHGKTFRGTRSSVPPPLIFEVSDEDPMHDDESIHVVCKAGNNKCKSLMLNGENPSLPAMQCDICCSEPNFCTDCCCILCCIPVSLEHGGYNYIKCEAVVHEGYICGHVAHINCALRAYMAGTVGGSIGLDAEYYCRRCDAKKDLIPHVYRFKEICGMVKSQADVEKILNLGICMLRGSKKAKAKELLICIESAVVKLKCRKNEDIGNADALTVWPEISDNGDAKDNETVHSLQEAEPIGPIPFNHQAEMQRLEEEICQVLRALRKAQETEYQIAEEKLCAQKEYLNDLYVLLEKEKSDLSRRLSDTDANDLITTILTRLDQIKKEVSKLREMEEIGKGFGRAPRGILEEYFHLRVDG
ncbi:PREDICTED: OBERON-like protein [Tarenaya hassleriana]|uniref:OBERON-like protein n=1 Tax=Tarenaya hassleriana TaxID=28532 RepID=UPI0008FD30C9|nr:PREDICTED: OBERON-like protein [Tarenaya hassleriana]